MPLRRVHTRFLAPFLALALCAAGPPAEALEQEAALWLSLRADGILDRSADRPAWRWLAEGQYRRFDALDGVRQANGRVGAGRRLPRGFTAWFGYDLQDLDRPAGGNLREHRTWQRLEWTARGWPVATFRSRTQLEQRHFEERSGTGWRLRQRLSLDFALDGGHQRTFFLSVEAFYALRDTDWTQSGFNQNRVFTGIAFDPSPATRMEIGYLHQWLRNRGGEDLVNHNLVLNWRWRKL